MRTSVERVEAALYRSGLRGAVLGIERAPDGGVIMWAGRFGGQLVYSVKDAVRVARKIAMDLRD
jgi:hypothetical protein